MLRCMIDEVIVLATLNLCVFHFCTSSVIRSGFLYCTSNHYSSILDVCGERKGKEHEGSENGL